MLKYYYNIAVWDIPEGFLCPPMPGRADYIHYAADLLIEVERMLPKGKHIKVLDIGVGANGLSKFIIYEESVLQIKFSLTSSNPEKNSV